MNISTRSDREQLKSLDATHVPADQREKIVAELRRSYMMEVETVTNYLANSIHLDGMLAQEVKENLQEDVQEELGHAQKLALRIKILGGYIPGSKELEFDQDGLQPPKDSIDIESVITGVIQAEDGAINQYQKIIEMTDGVDFVTQDLCIELKGDEEEHRRTFAGFLREYEAMKRMFG
ncbi:MAG: ferritin-like domain-containing protein [bacterium]